MGVVLSLLMLTAGLADDLPLAAATSRVDTTPLSEADVALPRREEARLSEVDPSRPPGAAALLHCLFDASWDANYDDWPDGWRRQRGPQYPHYLAIEIVAEPSARSGRCLQVTLDGGAAAVYSPPIAVDATFSYVLEGRLKTAGLKHDQAFFSITFFDAEGKPRETVTSEKFQTVADWRSVRLGPVSLQDDQIKTAVVGLHVEPRGKQDLRGSVCFDDIWFARLPHMTLSTNSVLNLCDDPGQLQVSCSVRGVAQREPEITFELLDVDGQSVAAETRQLAGHRIAVPLVEETGPGRVKPPAGPVYEARTVWQPQVDQPGYYRVRASLRHGSQVVRQAIVSLAICQPFERAARGQFGWTLPQGDRSIGLDELEELLPRAGIHWLKFPLWDDGKDPRRADRVLKFAQRLERDQITMVGMLDTPPPEVAKALPDGAQSSAASLFSADSKVWLPSLDPIMTRLSLQVRWWQLGGDRDRSFVGYPQLATKLEQIRKQLFRLGQTAQLGIGWDWLSELSTDATAPWQFVTLSATPPLTAAELATYLAGVDTPGFARWVLVEPLETGPYDLATRARDLVLKMMVATIGGANAIFLPDPFDPRHGVLNADGTPGVLLLPWRTTAMLLGGARHIGSIRMPQGSHNEIFARNGQAVMVMWRETPAEEVLFLGRDVEQVDLWGRVTRPRQQGDRQVIRVGPMPTFVSGINSAVAQWRMALTLEATQLPSVFGRPHPNAIQVKNFFPQGVVGEVRVVAANTLRIMPQRMRVKAAPGESQRLPFEIALPLGASTGTQDVRLDFNLSVDRRLQFSVYRQIQIGLGHVTLQTSTRLDDGGALIVQQQTKNNTDEKVSFRFLLYAPNRRTKRSEVVELVQGQDQKTYQYANGRTLLGRTLWLRAEEMDGPRVFNHRFVVEP